MITSIKIENFKAIESVTIEFNKMNVLIGANAAGKTTILQAMDFLFNSASKNCTDYLLERKWKLEDIKNQFTKSSNIRFETLFDLDVDGIRKGINWDIVFKINLQNRTISLISEVINEFTYQKFKDLIPDLSYTKHNINLLKYSKEDFMWRDEKLVALHIQPFASQESSSMLKDISSEDVTKSPVLVKLKEYIQQCASFELLAPESIRHGSKGIAYSIGKSGEKFATFFRNMGIDAKRRFSTNVSALLPAFDTLETIVRGRPGWVEIRLSEKYTDSLIKSRSAHISDGTLRILALLAITEVPSVEGTFLIDEIEDGVNPSITAKLLNILYKSLEVNERQIIFTTHSSVILDDIKPEDIIYVYRDAKGAIKTTKAFQKQKIKDMLTYMQPGEIWLNIPEEDLIAEDSEPLK